MRTGRALCLIVAFAVLSASPAFAGEPAFDHSYACLAGFLSKHVKKGLVNYSALALEKKGFEECLKTFNIKEKEYEAFSLDQKRAYWINAYNAQVLQVVIENYPIKAENLKFSKFPENSPMSIKGAWTDYPMKTALGKVTLSRMENNILPSLGEPFFIFAISNGTKGCPELPSEVFTPDKLGEQLDAATAKYLRNPNNVSLDPSGKLVLVSIYVKNHSSLLESRFFKQGQYNRDNTEISVMNLLLKFDEERLGKTLLKNQFQFKWTEINWTLNDLF